MNHARLSCSNTRWPECPGSVREEAKYVDVSSDAAIGGTGSHLLLELCLKNNHNARDYDKQIIGTNHSDHPSGWLIKSDRIERVQMCLDYVDRRVEELTKKYPKSTITVESEQKSDPGGMFGRDDWWGTVDITIICRTESSVPSINVKESSVPFIEIIDYKDGREYITALDNTQLISYMAGEMRRFIAFGIELVQPLKPEKVGGCRMTIVQPKTNPVIRYEDTKPEQVIDYASKLSLAAYATDKLDAPLTPGKHCRWCKANPKRGGHCTALIKQSLKTVKNMTTTDDTLFEYINKVVADPKSLTADQLADLADAEDNLFAAFQKVKDEIELRIEQGDQVPGYEMKPGRSSRAWNEDEEIIVKKLKGRRLKQNDIFPPKLVSVAVLMKSDKLTSEQKERIEKELVTVKAGELKLKKVSRDTPQQSFVDVIPPQVTFF